MNSIIIAQNELTMSSREIAAMTDKQHKHVLDDVRKICFQLEIDSAEISAQYKDSSGKLNREFILDKRMALILVSGYNLKMRTAIIDRWQELENKTPAIPQNLGDALRLAADQADQIQLMQPSHDFVTQLVERDTLMTATQVAQKHKLSARALNKILDNENGIYSKAVKRSRVFCQSWIDQGFGSMKQGSTGHSQALFTTKGEVKISEILTGVKL